MTDQKNNFSRRDMLTLTSQGFGTLAMMGLFGNSAAAKPLLKGRTAATGESPLAPRRPHFLPKARNVIMLYMDGGFSQMDTFDPKPMLDKYNGQDPSKVIGELHATQFQNNGKVYASPWKFKNHGESGIPISSLFPQISTCADDLCIIRSMVSEFPEHTNANYMFHTGHGLQGRPSLGAWAGYGLGTESNNLPGFVVLNGGLIPPGGLDNFNSGFLPANYQGSIFQKGKQVLANVTPNEKTSRLQQQKLSILKTLDRSLLGSHHDAGSVESAIQNYELAYKMQTAVPDLTDLSGESDATKKLYGLDSKFKPTQTYARQCLTARRLVERGVRFVELTCPAVGAGCDRWDQHSNHKNGHERNALAVDQPVAALLKDLKSRGMLDDTLVIFSGEFGRTPFAQGTNGRDHNPTGFSAWLAGGGVKGGHIHGATDDFGYNSIKDKMDIHDFHATILHLLGIDHTKLTYRFGGRDIRLTDVYGNVAKDIIA